MARSTSSPEAVVMAFFWTQPLEAANRALASGKLAVRHREEEIRNAPKVRVVAPATAPLKKSHHAAKPAAVAPKPKGKPGPKPKQKPEPISAVQTTDPASLFPADGSQPAEPPPVNLGAAS